MKMAFEYIDLKGFLLVVLFSIPLTLSTNINCGGKPFHCLNSTHFMICVDLGGGVSTTIDDFIIPCPASTECQRGNRFECEFPKNEVPTTPSYVATILENYDKSVLPQTMDNGATLPPIEENKVSPMLPGLEETTLKSDILEKLKEEFTGGNEKLFEGNVIQSTSTVSSSYNADKTILMDSIDDSVYNTEKFSNVKSNSGSLTTNVAKTSDIVAPKQIDRITPVDGLLNIESDLFLKGVYVPPTTTQTNSFIDTSTSMNEINAFSATNQGHGPVKNFVAIVQTSQMPTLIYDTQRQSADILFKHQLEHVPLLQNSESVPTSQLLTVNRKPPDILNSSKRAFEINSTHNDLEGKSNNSVTVAYINENTNSLINDTIEPSNDVPHKRTFFDKYFTTIRPIKTTTDLKSLAHSSTNEEIIRSNFVPIKPDFFSEQSVTTAETNRIVTKAKTMLEDSVSYFSTTTENNVESTILPKVVFDENKNIMNIKKITTEVVEPTKSVTTVTEVIQNVIPAPQFLASINDSNTSNGIDLSFIDRDSYTLKIDPTIHIQIIEPNKPISIKSVFGLNSTVINTQNNTAINNNDVVHSVAQNLTTPHEVNNIAINDEFVNLFKPPITVQSEYKTTTNTIPFPFSAYTTKTDQFSIKDQSKQSNDFSSVTEPLELLNTKEGIPTTTPSTEIIVFTATMTGHKNNVYVKNETLPGTSNKNNEKVTSDKNINSKSLNNIVIPFQNSLQMVETMGPNIEPPELVLDSTNRVTVKPHNSEIINSTFTAPTADIIKTIFHEFQYTPSTLTDEITKSKPSVEANLFTTAKQNSPLYTYLNKSLVSDILRSNDANGTQHAFGNSTYTNFTASAVSGGIVNNSLKITEQRILYNIISKSTTLPNNSTQSSKLLNTPLTVNSNFTYNNYMNFETRNDTLISDQKNNESGFVTNGTCTCTNTIKNTQQSPVVDNKNKTFVKTMEYTIPQDIVIATFSNTTNNNNQTTGSSIIKVDNNKLNIYLKQQPELPQVKSESTTNYSPMNQSNLSSLITNEPGVTVANNNLENKISLTFNCTNSARGKYADSKDCSNFYFCLGKLQPTLGKCPNNTVFSEINKQCTRNLSHCVRNNQFHCLQEGRYSDLLKDNVYYICVKKNVHGFLRYKLKCDTDYHLNKVLIKCVKNMVNKSEVSSSNSNFSYEQSDKSDFECKKAGLFPYVNDCRKYYLCTKISDGEFHQKIKTCSSEEMFDGKEMKCVFSESNEC